MAAWRRDREFLGAERADLVSSRPSTVDATVGGYTNLCVRGARPEAEARTMTGITAPRQGRLRSPVAVFARRCFGFSGDSRSGSRALQFGPPELDDTAVALPSATSRAPTIALHVSRALRDLHHVWITALDMSPGGTMVLSRSSSRMWTLMMAAMMFPLLPPGVALRKVVA